MSPKISIIKIKSAAVVMAFGSFALMSVEIPATAQAFNPASDVPTVGQASAEEKLLATGSSGEARTIDTENSDQAPEGELWNRVSLQPGDEIVVSPDKKTAKLVDKEGKELGSFSAPTILVDGKEYAGEFDYNDSFLITTIDESEADSEFFQESCGRAAAAKWSWRVAGALTCGAAGAATVVGGAACGLAWAGAEDAMNIDRRAC